MRLIIAFLLTLLSGLANASDSTTITNGQTLDINMHGVCKRVTNNSGQSQYIPTVSSGEWSSFYNTNHPGVTIVDCPAACGGVSIGGYCWYLVRAAQSCDAFCLTQGGCNLTGTKNYAGSGGSQANCQAVMNALDPAYSYPVNDSSNLFGDGVGCGVVNLAGGERRRYTSPETTCAGIMTNWRRACACNN